MAYREFLKWGGTALLGIAILGAVLPDGKLLGNNWYFTSAENRAHLIVGVLLIAGWYFGTPWLWRKLTIATMVAAFYFTLTGFLVRDLTPLNYYGIANLEYPWDELLHLIFVIWPAYVIWREKRSSEN